MGHTGTLNLNIYAIRAIPISCRSLTPPGSHTVVAILTVLVIRDSFMAAVEPQLVVSLLPTDEQEKER